MPNLATIRRYVIAPNLSVLTPTDNKGEEQTKTFKQRQHEWLVVRNYAQLTGCRIYFSSRGRGAGKLVPHLFAQYLDGNLPGSGAIIEIYEDYLLPGPQG